MNPNVHIAYRHLPQSEALTTYIEEEANQLASHYGRPLTCYITIEPYPYRAAAKRCRVKVEVRVPGRTLVAARSPAEYEGHDNVYLVVRQSFRAMKRQLDDRNHRRVALRHGFAN
jgi:ribosome-associated translation inhibitor RaiA